MATQILQEIDFEGGTGIPVDFNAGDTYQLQAFTADTWDGAAGSLNAFISSSAGTQATIDLTTSGDVGSGSNPIEYMSFTDIVFTGGICYANYKTCTGKDSNTSGIKWVGLVRGGNTFLPDTNNFLCECGVI